jgi:hypothetical protein
MSKEQNVQALTKFAEAANTGKYELFDEQWHPIPSTTIRLPDRDQGRRDIAHFSPKCGRRFQT